MVDLNSLSRAELSAAMRGGIEGWGQLFEHHVAPLVAESERLDHLAEAVNGAMHAAGMLVDADPAELADVIQRLQIQVADQEQAARYWKKRFDEDTTEAIDLLRAARAAEQRRAETLHQNCSDLAAEVERLRAVTALPVLKQEAWHVDAINAGIDAADSGKLADLLEVKANWERRAAARTDIP